MPTSRSDDNHRLSSEGWAALQRVFASRRPVLVLGPGCRRIAYDVGKPWEELVRRVALLRRELGHLPASESELEDDGNEHQLFVDHFWVAKLSDETRLTIDHDRLQQDFLPPELNIRRAPTGREDPLDSTRTALARDLLRAIFSATRCLGTVIATHTLPVPQWQDVSYRYPASDSEREEHAGDPVYELATAVHDDVMAAAALGRALTRIISNGDLTDEDDDALLAHGLQVTDINRAAASGPLRHMKVEAIADLLSYLEERCFGAFRRTLPLSGAIVEWLSDLFWHVLRVDSKVPPSQAELTFYVNLFAPEESEGPKARAFTRARPGDYRHHSDLQGSRLTDDIRDLLRMYEADKGGHGGRWTGQRAEFAQTIAASLLESWSAEKRREVPDWRTTGRLSKPVVALVSDYDLMLERALIRCLREDESFHVVVPVRVGSGRASKLDWLIGTYDINEYDSLPTFLTKPKWAWLSEEPSFAAADSRITGPVVVKLNGSPLHRLRDADESPTIEELALETRTESLKAKHDAETQVELTAVFSEHQSVEAIVSLRKAILGETLAADLLGEPNLRWSKTGWLFFGHRFSDWLPRLNVFVNVYGLDLGAKTARSEEPMDLTRVDKLAIDRDFNWPEIAVLDTLGIWRGYESLSNIANYTGPQLRAATRREKDRRFLEAVAARIHGANETDRWA